MPVSQQEMTAIYDDLWDLEAGKWSQGVRTSDIIGVVFARTGKRPAPRTVRNAAQHRRENPQAILERLRLRGAATAPPLPRLNPPPSDLADDEPTTQRSQRWTDPTTLDPDVQRLVDACRKKPRTLGELCDAIGAGPTRVSELAAAAREQGYPVELHGDRLAWHLPQEWHAPERTIVVPQPVGGWHMLAGLGDLHFGSKWSRTDYLKDFCDMAYERGVRTFFQVGDILDGEYKHGVRELRAHGFDEQADECIERLPQYPDAHWYFIDGNHDETFSKAAGFVSGAALVERARSQGRHDLTFLGQRKGLVRLDSGLAYSPLLELWHPKKGPAYADSYGIQKRCEGYAPGTKPDILLVGHWHRFCRIVSRGIHAWACGTMQGSGSAYGNAIGTPPALGGLLIGYQLTEQGTLRDAWGWWRAYYEREDVRRVDYRGKAASP